MLSLNSLYEQDLVEMLKLAFKIYDINKDGKISQSEMKKIIESFYDARGIKPEMRIGVNSPSNIARENIKTFDKNGDDLIDVNEFIDGCLKDLAFYSPIYFQFDHLARNFLNLNQKSNS